MEVNPDIIIHAGAVTNSTMVKNNPVVAINTNIIGTANISNYCIQQKKRLVYISTDYIYEGTVGNYKETDPILPYNEYALTNIGTEAKSVYEYVQKRNKTNPIQKEISTNFTLNTEKYEQSFLH